PGEAFTQRVPFDLFAEALDRRALARLPGALAELHYAAAEAAAQRPQHQPERRRRFALALAGMDDQQALFDRLGRHLGILRGRAVGHLGPVTGLVDCLGHAATLSSARRKGNAVQAAAAPATVVGEPWAETPLEVPQRETGKVARGDDPRAR